MFWADKLLENRTGKEVVNDSWTPSGIIHMGSLKGPIIHDVFYKVLKEKGADVKFIYGFDDADPIDGLPSNLLESHSEYLGVPIYLAPSPDGNGSFGDYFSRKMKSILDKLGIEAEVYKTSEIYNSGKFNDAIIFVLDHAEEIRKVYGKINKKEISKDWYPLQVVCSNCGKLGTTKVTGWDGKEVSFSCEENLVKWAAGCGTKGKIDPLNGKSKMPWKVEWAAKWWTFGVTIEGAGKDHSSAGGSYDVAMELAKEVFKIPQPLKFGYEFFLLGGKKMSSSKGLGLTGEELLEVLTPQAARFLMIKTRPEQTVEFDPRSPDIIPRIYDDYQKGSQAVDGDDLRRAFNLSQVGQMEKIPQIRFSVIAQWVQMPNMEGEIKKENADYWSKYAKVWIERYAPETVKYEVQSEIPEAARDLTDLQKEFLNKKLLPEIDNIDNPDEYQKNIYIWAKEFGLSSSEAFAAIYKSLIGKDHGPKVAWLIYKHKDLVIKRFQEIIEYKEEKKEKDKVTGFDNPKIFYIDKALTEKYPSLSIGIAVIKNVNIEKSNPELDKEKDEFLKSLEGITNEKIGEYSEVKSYRQLYREMGVDWHSRRPSPEALLRRIATNKGLYAINTCVDAYNIVVMENRVSIGAFDYDKLEFPTVLRYAKEGEEILLLGDSEQTKYKEKEIAYFDNAGGYNMDFNYRDAQRTAVQIETKNILVNVDGVFDITPKQVEEALREATDKIIKYCGGTIEGFGVVTA